MAGQVQYDPALPEIGFPGPGTRYRGWISRCCFITPKQIADALGISEKTVKVHRGHVMKKVEVRSVTDLVRLAEITADDS
ncbi:MAG: hypothetical protein GQ538_12225 [Xanthomonadales bacterium]|nr:hypothetical protein [Xanthomonadales bacterium]